MPHVFQKNSNNVGTNVQTPNFIPTDQELENLKTNILAIDPQPTSVLEFGTYNGKLSYLIREENPNILTVSLDDRPESSTSVYTDHNHFVVNLDNHFDLRHKQDNSKVLFDVIVILDFMFPLTSPAFSTQINNIVSHSTPCSISSSTKKSLFIFSTSLNTSQAAISNKMNNFNIIQTSDLFTITNDQNMIDYFGEFNG